MSALTACNCQLIFSEADKAATTYKKKKYKTTRNNHNISYQIYFPREPCCSPQASFFSFNVMLRKQAIIVRSNGGSDMNLRLNQDQENMRPLSFAKPVAKQT